MHIKSVLHKILMISLIYGVYITGGSFLFAEDTYKECLSLIAQEKYNRAYKIAIKYYNIPKKRREGIVLLSKIFIQKGKFEEAEKILKPYLTIPDVLNKKNISCYEEAVHYYIAIKEYNSALKLLDFLGKSQKSKEYVKYAELMADIFKKIKEYEKAIEYYKYAVSCGNTILKTDNPYHKLNKGIEKKNLQKRLNNIYTKLKEVEKLLRAKKCGVGYILYQEAEKFQLNKKYNEALEKYFNITNNDQVSEIFREASKFNICN